MSKITSITNGLDAATARTRINEAVKSVEWSDIDATAKSTDTTFAAANNTSVASTLAIKTYVDSVALSIDMRTSAAGDNAIGDPTSVITIIRKTAISVGGDTDTLPDPLNVSVGDIFILIDDSGTASSRNWTISQFGSETISGQGSVIIAVDYGATWFIFNGTNYNLLP